MGSEFVASRMFVERDVDLRSLLRILGVPIRGKLVMFGDNESDVNSSSTSHAKLHFHRVREAIALRVVGFII